MKRITLLFTLLALLAVPLRAADESAPAAAQETPAAKSLQDQVKENPDDTAVLNRYMSANVGRVMGLVNSDPDGAETAIAEMKQLLDSLQPTTDDAKQLQQQALRFVNSMKDRVELARTSREELQKKLQDNPEDAKSIGLYVSKVLQELGPLANSDAAKAEEQLAQVQKFLEELKGKAQDEAARKALASADTALARITSSIERSKRLAALVGSDAAPLAVEAWVNGEPLTDDDLKGKVVLLDFWAVWCGPCIATFPHLREWQEKYADKGLVIIGLTGYYNYKWDEEAGRATRSQDKVTPEDEQAMLVKFAESHNLHHRFAIQKGRELSEFYGVTGIPHVVVIDREGKVRLMRVGSGEQNAKDVGEMIEKLIADGA